jgi:hypothetical protein
MPRNNKGHVVDKARLLHKCSWRSLEGGTLKSEHRDLPATQLV